MAISVITEQMLRSGKDGETCYGILLLKSYTRKLTKNDKPYFEGKIQSGSAILPIKVWNGSAAFSKMDSEDYTNMVCMITGEYNQYQGNISVVISDIAAVSGYTPEQFYEVKYNKVAYKDALIKLCEQYVSEKGMALLNKMLFQNEDVIERFCSEFAASGHHDNCLSGLLVHTYKVSWLMSWMLATYPEICLKEDGSKDADKRDLYMIGAVMHDIGKIDEMHYGVYQPESAVSHRIIGLDYLYQFRADIEEAYSSAWFRNFQSIIVEHHGEFADPCRTVFAYAVHNADMLDSCMTLLAQTITEATKSGVSDSVKIDGTYLAM